MAPASLKSGSLYVDINKFTGIRGIRGASQSPSFIPKDTDRPCYRVLDGPHEEGDAKSRAGFWYFGIKPGRGEAPPTLVQQWVCSPIHVEAVTTDPSAGNYGRLLRFKTTLGNWRTWAMPMDLLRGGCCDLRG